MPITGTKQWTDETVLYAVDMNQYLMRGVKVFATATARNDAYGGAGEPTLEEGEVCYLLDSNTIHAYNGTAWMQVAAAVEDDQMILSGQVFS